MVAFVALIFGLVVAAITVFDVGENRTEFTWKEWLVDIAIGIGAICTVLTAVRALV